MTTRLMTAGIVLVAAIIFGLIFWNQFTSNQQKLAGNTPAPMDNAQSSGTVTKKDNMSLIEADLNQVDPNTMDSDSTQVDTELKGY